MTITGPRVKTIRSILVWVAVVFCFAPAVAGAEGQIKTDKDTYHPGEALRVNFSGAPGHNSDWICIVTAGAPDTEAGDYQYMPQGMEEGVLIFALPAPGKYEVRAYYNYRRLGYVVSARHGFTVTPAGAPAVTAAVPHAAPPPDAAAAKPVRSAESTAAPGRSTMVNVAVFRFTPLNMDAATYGITATNAFINAPKMQSSFAMMDRKDLEFFLVSNDLQQNDETANVIDIGARIGLNFVIAGTVEKRGMAIVINSKVISVEKKKVIFADRYVSIGESDLMAHIVKISDAMIEAIRQNTP